MPAPKHIKPQQQEDKEPTAQILKLVKEQLNARKKLDTAKKKVSELQSEYDELRKDLLPAAMEAAGITSFKGLKGGRCHLTNKTYFNVRKEDTKKLHAWLKKNKLESIIVPTVNHNTLSSTLKNEVQEGKKLPTFINTHDEVVAVVSGGKDGN